MENVKFFPDYKEVFIDERLKYYFKPICTIGKYHFLTIDGIFCIRNYKFAENDYFGFKLKDGKYEFLGNLDCLRQDHIAGISLEDGGFVCHDCLSLHDKQLDKVTLKAFRHINKLTIDSIDQLKVPDESIDLLMEIMDYYVDEMTGILFKTKKMIQSLSKI